MAVEGKAFGLVRGRVGREDEEDQSGRAVELVGGSLGRSSSRGATGTIGVMCAMMQVEKKEDASKMD
jgi:hypothetical protein